MYCRNQRADWASPPGTPFFRRRASQGFETGATRALDPQFPRHARDRASISAAGRPPDFSCSGLVENSHMTLSDRPSRSFRAVVPTLRPLASRLASQFPPQSPCREFTHDPVGLPFVRGRRARQKSDHPGYSFERTHWVLITGVEPLRCAETAFAAASGAPFTRGE